MNDTLKVAGRIGAELGATKAENEKLRGLLRELREITSEYAWDVDLEAKVDAALSQQADPCGTCEPEGVMATDGSGPFDCPDCGKKAAARNGSESVETRAVTGLEGDAHTTPDTYTAVDMATAAAQGFRDGQAAVEQAAVQDERNPTSADYLAARAALESCDWSNVPLGTKAILGRAVDLLWLAAQARPAQTEQQSVAVVPEEWKAGFKLHEIHKALDCGLPAPSYWAETCDGEPHVHTKLWSGLPGCGSFHSSRFWPLYGVSMLAFPIAQTAPNSDCEWCAGAGKDHFGEKCEHCQTAPQHPDDAAVDRFAVAMKVKLAAARAKGRGGWENKDLVGDDRLAEMLVEHLCKGNAGTFEDVANFSMMLHQRGADPKVLAEAAALSAQGQSNGDS